MRYLLPLPLFFVVACQQSGPQAAAPPPATVDSPHAVATPNSIIDSVNSGGNHAPAPTDTAGVPVLNWAVPGEGMFPFRLPMHSENFDLLAKRFRFDRASLQELRMARMLSLSGSCSDWSSDSVYFKSDFEQDTASIRTYRVAWGRYEDRAHNSNLFALIAPGDGNRVYLFTQRVKTFPADPVRVGSVLLLHSHEGNRNWGLDRSCRMLAPGELLVETECWEYTPSHPKGDHFRALHRVAIADPGLLRSATLRNIRVPG
ncbi:hypothetical protein [Flaviaesturariibacter aridisoli]|uniref:Uncharacterized protein n=1 Tax=Flaviaesturariibacter aridisoli TaxID=2545761 RepID=A0A4R4E3W6_9BACT|nr:hypothetical protein [Flaviaesturariibacter aridisoli]TCZ71041.1 hypothetical protein E0486_10480 [Flaviaesturariibacter aridisoli]